MGGPLVWNKERMAEQRRAEREAREKAYYAHREEIRRERNLKRISRKEILGFYADGMSMHEIALRLGCSIHKIAYWMERYRIPRRGASEATYRKRNPAGDPFKVMPITTRQDAFIAGLGLGLYWGEGTRANVTSVRFGNADPRLIRALIAFLKRRYGVSPRKLKFRLQVFSDTSPTRALGFWCRALGVSAKQFKKVVAAPARGKGTYRRRLEHGVVTVYFHNKKLRDILMHEIERISF